MTSNDGRHLSRAFLIATTFALLGTQSLRAQSDPWGRHGYIDINGLYEATTQTAELVTEPEINEEIATITAQQEVGQRPLLDVNVGHRIRRNFGIGGGVTYGASSSEAEITGSIPHPFYFNQPRPLSGSASLDRRDLMLHIHPMWLMPLTPKLSATVFGGATWFHLQQDTISSITVSESFPYDEVSLAAVDLEAETASHWGGHLGGDVSYAIARNVGIQGVVRYTHGTVTVTSNGVDSAVAVGGLHVGAGLRVRF